jgi:hypothetical protein
VRYFHIDVNPIAIITPSDLRHLSSVAASHFEDIAIFYYVPGSNSDTPGIAYHCEEYKFLLLLDEYTK